MLLYIVYTVLYVHRELATIKCFPMEIDRSFPIYSIPIRVLLLYVQRYIVQQWKYHHLSRWELQTLHCDRGWPSPSNAPKEAPPVLVVHIYPSTACIVLWYYCSRYINCHIPCVSSTFGRKPVYTHSWSTLSHGFFFKYRVYYTFI